MWYGFGRRLSNRIDGLRNVGYRFWSRLRYGFWKRLFRGNRCRNRSRFRCGCRRGCRCGRRLGDHWLRGRRFGDSIGRGGIGFLCGSGSGIGRGRIGRFRAWRQLSFRGSRRRDRLFWSWSRLGCSLGTRIRRLVQLLRLSLSPHKEEAKGDKDEHADKQQAYPPHRPVRSWPSRHARYWTIPH